MEILLDNSLAKMYGPYFLILYSAVTFLTIIIFALIRIRIDQSGRLPVPPIPSNIDPYEIAYLRGGLNEMARAAVFSLTQKGLLEIKDNGAKKVLTRTRDAARVSTATVEDAALGWFFIPRESFMVFTKDGLVSVIEPFAEDYRRRLGRQQLITDTDMKKQLSLWKWLAILIVLGLGLYKGFAAIMNDNFNVIGLVVIAFVGAVTITVIGRLPWLTVLGKSYLVKLQNVFEKLKYRSVRETAEPQSAAAWGVTDPLLLAVGIFGSVVLVGTAYGAHDEMFMRQQGNAGGGCGAGGSSCSSGGSDGGSGCSSGCGGGCGGCS